MAMQPKPFHEQLKYQRLLNTWSQEDLARKLYCEARAVRRWEAGEALPRPAMRRQICDLFGIDPQSFGLVTSSLSSETSADLALAEPEISTQPDPIQLQQTRVDWSETPRVQGFYGRQQELAQLEHWLNAEHCQVIAVLGIGGMGKTTLSAALVERLQAQKHFDCISWRSLHNAQPLEHILRGYIQFISEKPYAGPHLSVNDQISDLLYLLRERRCLLVLDNLESILQEGDRAGLYREGYEEYGYLIERLGREHHQSCLLLTSREKPREVAHLEGQASPVRVLALPGVSQDAGRAILQDKVISGSEADWQHLIELYAGNPMALKLVSESIHEVFGGQIGRFLQEGETSFGDIHALLETHVRRLSPPEREVLNWLALEREPVTLETLRQNLVLPSRPRHLVTVLESLRRRSIMEVKDSEHFMLQPLVMAYVTEAFVEQACEEFQARQFELWNHYAFLKAQASDYVRTSQQRLIMAPISELLQAEIGLEELEQQLRNVLAARQQYHLNQPGYLAGNLLNFLIYLGCDLRGSDFSQLLIRQAYLRNVPLAHVNFSQARFVDPAFNDTFGNILSTAFSPDSTRLALGTATGEIAIYDAASAKRLLTCSGHSDGVWALAFAPDGQLLISSSDDQTVRLWDPLSGKQLKILREHEGRIRALAFHPQGQLFASGSDDQTIRLWDATTASCLATLTGHSGRVWALAFAPTGQFLASASTDHDVRLWDYANAVCLGVLTGHTQAIRSLAFHPQGQILVSGSDDQTIRLWDPQNQRLLETLSGHTNRVWSVAFSARGTLASGSEDNTVRLWQIQSPKSLCVRVLQDHTHGVRSVNFSPDGSLLASGGDDQTARLYDGINGQSLKTFQGYTRRLWSIDFSPDGHSLVSAGEDQTIRLWDIQSGKLLSSLHDSQHGVRCVAFHPGGRLLASGGEDQQVWLWDIQREHPRQKQRGHSDWLRCVDCSPDGHLLASGGEDRTICLWELDKTETVTLPPRRLEGHTSWVRAVIFSPDGRLLASGGDDATIRLWDPQSGDCLRILDAHRGRVRALAFQPAGHLLASASEDQTLRLWDLHTGRCLRVLKGHNDRVCALAFQPGGRLLASGDDDATIRLWDPQTGDCLRVLSGHSDRVRSLSFSPLHDQLLASGSDDGMIKLWNVQQESSQRTLISERPYERMNLSGARGLTEAQKETLIALGAVFNP